MGKQAHTVKLILKEIMTKIDDDLEEKGDRMGRLSDIPRDANHPFLPLVPLRILGIAPGEVLTKTSFTFDTKHSHLLKEMEQWMTNGVSLRQEGPTKTSMTIEGTPLSHQVRWSETFRPIVEAFNRMMEEWQEPSAYWFHDDELIDTSFFNNFGVSNADEFREQGSITLQEFSSCALSINAVHTFADLMLSGEVIPPRTPRQDVANALRSMRGVVRARKENAELLVYMKYPWALYANGELAQHPFPQAEVSKRLQDWGRSGCETSEGLCYRGYIVEWRLPGSKEEEEALAKKNKEDVPKQDWKTDWDEPVKDMRPANSKAVPSAPYEKHDSYDYPQNRYPEYPSHPSEPYNPREEVYNPNQMPYDGYSNYDYPYYDQRYGPEHMAPPPPVMPPPPPIPPPPPSVPSRPSIPDGGRIYVSQCWIPMEVYAASHLRERISGPNDAHFAHILTKNGPGSVEVAFQGLPNAQAPVNQRLKVVMRSASERIIDEAFNDLMDLVETLVEVVAEELNMPRQHIDQMVRQIQTDCCVMQDGVRIETRERPLTPLQQLHLEQEKKQQQQQMQIQSLQEQLRKHQQEEEQKRKQQQERQQQEQKKQQEPELANSGPNTPRNSKAPLPTGAEDGEYELVSDEEYVAVSESESAEMSDA